MIHAEDFGRNPLRTRVVTFRLTEEEYDWLKNLCDGSANSISAAARSAVLSSPPVSNCALAERRLESLGYKLDEIIRLLTPMPTGATDVAAPEREGLEDDCR